MKKKKAYSKGISSENITSVINTSYLTKEYVHCPVDKLYLRKESIDHEKLKLFKDHSKSNDLIRSLKTLKDFRKIFLS
jgi:hypothetical protein